MNRQAKVLTNEEKTIDLYHHTTHPTKPADVNLSTDINSLNLNWSEKDLPERTRTKHVHRLHPYLGKFIPQLAEIFLRKYFSVGDTVLDPFIGSGTTSVQALELGINSVGCDISAFNILISKVKTAQYDFDLLAHEVSQILEATESTCARVDFNAPPKKYTIANEYLNSWFANQAHIELLVFKSLIPKFTNQDFLRLVLSRSARSARLTTHFDLDFPKKPANGPYECYKHRRICTPTQEAYKFLRRYAIDGVKRVQELAEIRLPDTKVKLIHGDSRIVDFPEVDGVITSPPYVGLIDYHEQHRYAYELLGIKDLRKHEIGPAERGKSIQAKKDYKVDVANVLVNASKKIKPGGKLIVVAGDRDNLYPDIQKKANLQLEEKIERHVNRRTGRRNGKFFESVFIYNKI